MTLPAERTRADRTLERLYRRHAGDVYRYALAVLHNQPDAEDVTRTTFLNARRALARHERPESPQTWLISIAHNVCRHRLRHSPADAEWDDEIDEGESEPSGEELGRALTQLGSNQRAALVMRELEGRSYAEIAAALELPIGAVESLIFRARRALREQLEAAITCTDAELAISRQLDGRLSRDDAVALGTHLRDCSDCATFARRQRSHRVALRSLGSVPLPASLASRFGAGGGGGGGVRKIAASFIRARHLLFGGRALVPKPRGHAARGSRGSFLPR